MNQEQYWIKYERLAREAARLEDEFARLVRVTCPGKRPGNLPHVTPALINAADAKCAAVTAHLAHMRAWRLV